MPQPARGLAVRVERRGTSRRRCRPRQQRLPVLVAVKPPPWPSPHGGEGKPTLALPPWWGGKTHPGHRRLQRRRPLVGRETHPGHPPWWGGKLSRRSPVPHQCQKAADLIGTRHHDVAMSEEVVRRLG